MDHYIVKLKTLTWYQLNLDIIMPHATETLLAILINVKESVQK